MKLRIYLTKGGVEKVAAGKEHNLYNWDFSVRAAVEGLDCDECPEDAVWLGEAFEVSLPVRDSVLPKAVAALEKEKQEAYLEAQETVRKVDERLQNLLAVGYDSPRARVVASEAVCQADDCAREESRADVDDIPF